MVIAVVVLVTLLTLGLLMVKARPTVVELRLHLSGVDFEVLPPLETINDVDPSALREMPLLDESLEIEELEVRDAVCVEATLEGLGRLSLSPLSGGNVHLDDSLSPDGEPSTFTPKLIVRQPTRVRMETTLPQMVRLSFEQPSPAHGPPSQPVCRNPGQGRGWSASLDRDSGLQLGWQKVAASDEHRRRVNLPHAGMRSIALDAPSTRLWNGGAQSRMNLALPRDAEAATFLRVLDPATGTLVESRRVPEVISEARTIPLGNRLLLLDPAPAEIARRKFFRPNLQVRSVDFSRQVGFEKRSFIHSGTLRFPAAEKEPIELEQGFYLDITVPANLPLTLRSLEVVGDHIELILWGAPSSVRMGPTPELRSECLPSYLEWLYSERRGGLLYATVAWLAGAIFAVLQALGIELVHKKE